VRENTLRTIWSRGGNVVNGWLSIPSAFSAEVTAHQGFAAVHTSAPAGKLPAY
jgi:4-hydroxy-2-oxoheptanedioate aldolase